MLSTDDDEPLLSQFLYIYGITHHSLDVWRLVLTQSIHVRVGDSTRVC